MKYNPSQIGKNKTQYAKQIYNKELELKNNQDIPSLRAGAPKLNWSIPIRNIKYKSFNWIHTMKKLTMLSYPVQKVTLIIFYNGKYNQK